MPKFITCESFMLASRGNDPKEKIERYVAATTPRIWRGLWQCWCGLAGP